MHTFGYDNVTIHHNGDYSGDARIRVDEETDKGVVHREFRIPCRALIEFSKAATISEIIAKLEEME